MTTRSRITSTIVGAGMLTLFLAPAATLAATSSAPARSTNAKSVSLVLADVRHVLGGGLTAGYASYSKPTAMGTCTSTPPVTHYAENFLAGLHTKGILAVINDVYTYKRDGAACNQNLAISMNKLVAVGKLTLVHGVGEQAYVLDTTGPKTRARPVYTLGINFIRGPYRALIIVQSNQTIKVADMIKLGKIVDGRMRRTH
jgi:hypothetical protein